MFAVGAGGGCLDIFFSQLSFLSSFFLSLGDGPIQTEILFQRVVKPITTNQPTTEIFFIYKQITRDSSPIYGASAVSIFVLFLFLNYCGRRSLK